MGDRSRAKSLAKWGINKNKFLMFNEKEKKLGKDFFNFETE